MLKTGLIQPETIPGNFPRNLRTIVELYRSCLDGGAELVLCPPLALSGMHTGELALRGGFRSQHRAALAYLAREITEVPLLLGAADAEGLRFHLLRNGRYSPFSILRGLRPRLRRLPEHGGVRIFRSSLGILLPRPLPAAAYAFRRVA
jgi:hypothetical protein